MTELEPPVAPESFIANKEDKELIKRRDDYLGRVLDSLGFKEETERGVIKFESYDLPFIESGGKIRSSDDKLTVLIVRDDPVAFVLQRISEDGYVRFSAVCLTKEAKLGLRYMPGIE